MSEHFVTYDQVQSKIVRKTVQIELKYCPFCGGEATFRESKGLVGVRCKITGSIVIGNQTGCGATTAMRGGPDPHLRAAEVWNRRAQE